MVRELFVGHRLVHVVPPQRLQVLQPRPQLGIDGEAVGLVLVLLDLADDLGHLAAFGEVDELGVVEKVRVALLQEPKTRLEE